MKPMDINKPHLIIMVGIPGSGKSFFAEQFAETFKAPIVSINKLSQELFNFPISSTEEEVVHKIADQMLSEILKTGKTIIYEGYTSLRADRMLISKKAKDNHYEPLFIWVQTEQLTAKKRATKTSDDKYTLNSEQFDNKIRRFSVPHKSEKVIVISGKHTYLSQLKIVLKHLARPATAIETSLNTAARPPIKRNYLIR